MLGQDLVLNPSFYELFFIYSRSNLDSLLDSSSPMKVGKAPKCVFVG